MKLYNRLSSFYIVINVPKCLRKRIGKSQIWRSLHTKDRRIANLRAGMIKMSVHKLFTEEQMKEAQEIDGMLRDISCDGIGHSEMDYTEDFAEMVAYEACREKVGSSFWDEAFAGLVFAEKIPLETLDKKLELARRAVQVYKMSDAKNPVKTGNRVVDFATGRLPLVKDWNKGFNLGKLGFVAQQTYKDTCKRKK